VLGIFLGGLALGYRVFGRVTRWHLERAREQGRIPRLLLVYGFVEGWIGLHAHVCAFNTAGAFAGALAAAFVLVPTLGA